MSIYRDFMVPRLCQFKEILWSPTMSIYRDFHDQAKRIYKHFYKQFEMDRTKN